MSATSAPDPTTSTETRLSPLHVVVPMRTVSGGKARLGGALDAEEREELVVGMLHQTLTVLSGWDNADAIHLVSPDQALLAAAVGWMPTGEGVPLKTLGQPGEGLNEAVSLAMVRARAEGASALLVLPGDLPELTSDPLDELLYAADAAIAAAEGGTLVAIVPSDARGGTNALLLDPVDAIAPAFGAGSFEAHLRAAAVADAAVQVVTESALGFDLDTPDDLERVTAERLRSLMALGREVLATDST